MNKLNKIDADFVSSVLDFVNMYLNLMSTLGYQVTCMFIYVQKELTI